MNRMDTMERYRIQVSIKEVIANLDSAPVRRDLIPETNVVQLAGGHDGVGDIWTWTGIDPDSKFITSCQVS